MTSSSDVVVRALQLPETDRAHLAHQLLASLGPDTFAADWESCWRDEIERRLDKVASGRFVAHDWHEALAEIRAQLQKENPSEAASAR